jgi:hypothetical protein
MAFGFEVHLVGPVPRTVLQTIQNRFGDVSVTAEPDGAVMTGLLQDQPQLRGLLAVIWDAGGSIRYLAVNDEHATGASGQGTSRSY